MGDTIPTYQTAADVAADPAGALRLLDALRASHAELQASLLAALKSPCPRCDGRELSGEVRSRVIGIVPRPS